MDALHACPLQDSKKKRGVRGALNRVRKRFLRSRSAAKKARLAEAKANVDAADDIPDGLKLIGRGTQALAGVDAANAVALAVDVVAPEASDGDAGVGQASVTLQTTDDPDAMFDSIRKCHNELIHRVLRARVADDCLGGEGGDAVTATGS